MGAALAVSRAPKSHCPAWCSQSWASCWVLRRAQEHFRCLVPSVPPPVRDAWNPSSHPSAWPEAVGRIPLSGQALELCMCWWGWRPPGMQPSPPLLQDGLWVVVTALAAGTHISPAAPSSLWSAGSICFAAGDALSGFPCGTGCSLRLQQRCPLHSASHPRGLHRKDILKITAGTRFIFDKGAN